MTPEQQKALAIARARRRRAEAQSGPTDAQRAYMEQRAQGAMPAPVAQTGAQMAAQGAIDATTEAGMGMGQPQPMSNARSMAGGLLQGATYGFADEIGAALTSPFTDKTYSQMLDQARGVYSQAQEDNPIAFGTGEIGGAVGTSLGAGAAFGLGRAGIGLGTRAGQGAALGAGEGALYGFGSGEGVEDRLKGAATYGAAGGAIGAAAPFAIEGVRRGADALIGGPLASMRSAPSEKRAGRAILDALQRSGLSADDVRAATQAAAREGQPEFIAADAMGKQGQRLLSSLARQPTEAQAEIVEFLTSRQGAQGERLSRIIADALDAPETAAARQSALTKARGDAADVAYKAARQGAGPVDVRGAISVIDDRIGGMAGSNIEGDGIDAVLSRFRNRLAAKPAPAGELSRELSDFDRVLGVKQDLGDVISKAKIAGEGNKVRELMDLQRSLDAALEAASDGYRAANDEFAKASRIIDQIDAGKAAASPRVREADVLAQYGALTPEQQAAFRVGRADVTLGQIESAAEGANKARPLTSGKAQSELPAMAQDPDLLRRQIGRENVMFETSRKTLGGSETAERLADDTNLQTFAVGPLANVLGGRFGAAAQQIGGSALNALQGRNTATRDMIARALLSGSLDDVLQPAMRADLAAGRQNKVVEALMRSLPRLTN
jgi:hypothetical protein